MFNKRDRRCAAVQQMFSTDPSYDNRTIASTQKIQIWIATNNGDAPRVMKTKFAVTVMVFGVVSSEGHIMSPHIFEVGLKVNTKVYLDVLKSVVISWCNQVDGGRPWLWQQESAPTHNSKEIQAWLQRSTKTLYPSHQYDLPQHQSQPDRRHPPSIHRATAGACGKGILQVLDPYRGDDWGWRRLH